MNDIKPEDLIDTSENKPLEQEPKEEIIEEAFHDEKAETKQLEIKRKPIKDLTQEEKDYLINLYKNGGEDGNFKVKFYKNGNYSIVKKNERKQTTSERVIENSQNGKPQKENSKIKYLSTQDLLMEHVIDLESKYAYLEAKHKSLKKKYKQMKQDIYEDDEEIGISQMKQEPENLQQEPEQQEQPQQIPRANFMNRPIRNKTNWRSMIMKTY